MNRLPFFQTKVFDSSVVKSQVTDVALIQRRREQIVEAAIALFSRQQLADKYLAANRVL